MRQVPAPPTFVGVGESVCIYAVERLFARTPAHGAGIDVKSVTSCGSSGHREQLVVIPVSDVERLGIEPNRSGRGEDLNGQERAGV